MGYSLGVDVGTTFTAAAVWRDERVEVVALEAHRVTVPTVIFAAGEEVRFGDAAVARAASAPDSVAREFKRRLGDPVPVFMSGAPYSADRLLALFVKWVRDAVAAQFGGPPDRTTVTHPANWTEFQQHLLATALAQAGLEDVDLLTEPEAAAIDFGATANVAVGDVVLVYDLGGGTFDVALLRREVNGLSSVGEGAGVERLGGIDFDEALFRHVLGFLSSGVVEMAHSDANGRLALAQLRLRCVEAKEALSSDVVVDMPVLLPGLSSTVRVTRAEFEDMIRPMLLQTIDLVRGVLQQAQLEPQALAAILLVGGSSRIPLVAELVGSALQTPIRVDAHPKVVVARGAARWAGTRPERPLGDGPRAPALRARHAPPEPGAPRRRIKTRTFALVAGAVVAIAAVSAFLLLRSSDDVASPFPAPADPVPPNVLLFTRLNPNGVRQIFSVDLDRPADDPARAQRVITLAGSTWDHLPALSQDRRLIAYSSQRGGTYTLVVSAWNGGGKLLLLDDQPLTISPDARSTWSQDDTRLAYVADRDGTEDLYVFDADSLTERRLTRDDLGETDPSWSPTSDAIVYSVPAPGNGRDLVRIDAGGGDPVPLTSGPDDDDDPAWSPDGTQIAFTRQAPGGDAPKELFVMDADGSNVRRLISPAFESGTAPKNDSDPSWSPDGTKIAFESTRDDGIWIVDAAGGDPTPVVRFASWISVHPAWS